MQRDAVGPFVSSCLATIEQYLLTGLRQEFVRPRIYV